MQLHLFDENVEMRSPARVRDHGEVFTTSGIVEAMLDLLLKDIWTDPTKTILEPSCGNGAFLVAIQNRLMKTLKPHFPDAAARHRHIIKHMLYAVDILPDNVADTIDRLAACRFAHHIVVGDFLKSTADEMFHA